MPLIQRVVELLERNLTLRAWVAYLAFHARRVHFLKNILKRTSRDPWADHKDNQSHQELLAIYKRDLISADTRAFDGKIAFMVPENSDLREPFLAACNELAVDGVLLNPRSATFLADIKEVRPDILLVRPGMSTSLERMLDYELTECLVHDLHAMIYPTLKELRIYEAKRALAMFLQAHNIPHPETRIFLRQADALAFVETATYPLVFKTNTGASASGVEIVESRLQARRLIKAMFNRTYVRKQVPDYRDIDYNYVILQRYIPGVREHRVIKIGDSWFGHEKAKLETQTFMSGSGVNSWTPPSTNLLNFCRNIAESHNFTTMCFDVFEDQEGVLYINELQTWFGSFNPSQMYKDGIPGRYRYHAEHGWIFEEGLYNTHRSLTLRIAHAVKLRMENPVSSPKSHGGDVTTPPPLTGATGNQP